jgi:prevent-host-death family protein
MRMGLREANQNFSKAIKAVKAGQTVVLTERGKPIAMIQPYREPKGQESELQKLRDDGFLTGGKSAKHLPPWMPVKTKGVPLSKLVQMEREAD